MSRYHDSITGKFVSKQYAKDNPETTVKLTHVDLKKELIDFFLWFRKYGEENLGISIEAMIEKYLKEKE